MNAHTDAIEAITADVTYVNTGRHFRHVHRPVTGSALPLAWSQGLARLDATTAGLAGLTTRLK